MTLTLAASHGAIAAELKLGPSITAASVSAPVSIAGRWSGSRYGYGARTTADGCEDGLCTLTLDIMACGSEWCGIVVNKDQTCGVEAMHVKGGAQPDRKNAFTGKIELAKGSDAYVIEAWYAPASDEAVGADAAPRLSIVGDTGPELMMFRRSFPFSAELARAGDAKCGGPKATS